MVLYAITRQMQAQHPAAYWAPIISRLPATPPVRTLLCASVAAKALAVAQGQEKAR